MQLGEFDSEPAALTPELAQHARNACDAPLSRGAPAPITPEDGIDCALDEKETEASPGHVDDIPFGMGMATCWVMDIGDPFYEWVHTFSTEIQGTNHRQCEHIRCNLCSKSHFSRPVRYVCILEHLPTQNITANFCTSIQYSHACADDIWWEFEVAEDENEAQETMREMISKYGKAGCRDEEEESAEESDGDDMRSAEVSDDDREESSSDEDCEGGAGGAAAVCAVAATTGIDADMANIVEGTHCPF